MAGDTKERILKTALELFAQNGYLGTSMNDIAQQLGFTKAALYKHYTSKQEILDRIVEHMNEMDYERAESYEMPETEPDGFAEALAHGCVPGERVRVKRRIAAAEIQPGEVLRQSVGVERAEIEEICTQTAQKI